MEQTTKKRILIFSLAYDPFVGGAEVAIKKITDLLPEYEWEMITCNLDGRQKAAEKIGNISVHRIGGGKSAKYSFSWLAFNFARRLQQKQPYDIIWAMMANQAGWAALKFKREFPRVKYLLTLQEGDSEFDILIRTFFIRHIYKAIYRQADHIQAISNYLKARAVRLGAKCPIEVIPNGIDVSRVKEKVLRADPEEKIVITASRLVKKNGIGYLIEAIGILRKKNIPVILWVVGSGKLENKLKKMAAGLGIADKVKFFGQVSNDQVYELLSQADIFARPSLSEGLGNAFLEAMAAGLPTIGTPVGGIPDFLKDGETGWLSAARNSAGIAEKIRYILDEKNLERVVVVNKQGSDLARGMYNWQSVAKEMNDIILKLTS